MSTAEPKQPPASFKQDAWALAIMRNQDVKKSAEHVAWLISLDADFWTKGCTAEDPDIAARLDLAANTVKNALISLRAAGSIVWSRCTVDGVHVRTIQPDPRWKAGHSVETVSLGDVQAPIAGAVPSPFGGKHPHRPRRYRSDVAVCPTPEPLSAGTDVSAPAGFSAPDTACTIANCTQNGCDADPSPGKHELEEDGADRTPEVEILRVFQDPPSSNSTQIGCDTTVAQATITPRRSRKRYDRSMPLWMQGTDVQYARAAFHAEQLSWDARCEHDGCGSRSIAFLCADEGTPLCARHGGYANLPVALAIFGLDRRR